MANDRTPPDLQGFLLPARQFTAANLVAKDDGTTPSTYTQSGRRTGVPKATADTAMVIQGSGTQDEDGHIEIVCQRQGTPGIDRGKFVHRDEAAGDSASQFYGREPVTVITHEESLFATTGTNVHTSFWADVIPLDDGTLLAVVNQNTTTDDFMFRKYNPGTSAWTATNVDPDSVNWNSDAASLIQLPKASGDANGRILFFFSDRSEQNVNVAYSDDLGATWAPWGRRVLDTNIQNGVVLEMRARYANGQILLLVTFTNSGGATDMEQHASADLGASFQQVSAAWRASESEDPRFPNIIPIRGGGFLVVYVDEAAGKTISRRVGSAFSNLQAVTKGLDTLGHTNAASVCAWRGENGAVYVFTNDNTGTDRLICCRSTDDGTTWDATYQTIVTSYASAGSGSFLHNFAAAEVEGRGVMVTRWTSNATSTYDPRSTKALWLGGPTRHTVPANIDSVNFHDQDIVTWADDDFSVGNTSLQGIYGYPEGTSSFRGFPVTTAGSPTIAMNVNLKTSITTAGGSDAVVFSDTYQGNTGESFNNRSTVELVCEFQVEIDSGDGDAATTEIAARLIWSDGSSTLGGGVAASALYDVTIRLDSAGYQLWDETAGSVVGSEQALDFTSEKTVRVILGSDGTCKTFYLTHAHHRAFAESASARGTISSAGTPGADGKVEFGHFTAAANVSRWGSVRYATASGRYTSVASDLASKTWANPGDLHGADFPTDFALIKAGAEIRGIDGPARIGDTWDIKARYDHPVSQWFADDPSPRRRGRSTGDNANQDLVIKQDATSSASMLNGSTVGAFVRGANFPDFTLDRWTGSAWATVASATGEIASLQFTRNGRYIVVNTGTVATASQFIRWGDLVGGTFAFDDGTMRTILRNTSGAWTDKTTNRVSLELDPDEMTGSEPTSGTAGKVWFSDYGVIAHDYTATSQIFRIRIPTSQTARDYYTGKFIVGPVAAFGWSHDRTWSLREEHDVEVVTRPGGFRQGVKRAPTRRVLQIGWVDTSIDESQTLAGLSASFVPDYVAANVNPSATRHATISDVLGIMREQGGPSDPVIMLRAIKPGVSSQQYLGSHLWIHGRIETTDPQVDNLLGREATDPMSKLNQIAITEEV